MNIFPNFLSCYSNKPDETLSLKIAPAITENKKETPIPIDHLIFMTERKTETNTTKKSIQSSSHLNPIENNESVRHISRNNFMSTNDIQMSFLYNDEECDYKNENSSKNNFECTDNKYLNNNSKPIVSQQMQFISDNNQSQHHTKKGNVINKESIWKSEYAKSNFYSKKDIQSQNHKCDLNINYTTDIVNTSNLFNHNNIVVLDEDIKQNKKCIIFDRIGNLLNNEIIKIDAAGGINGKRNKRDGSTFFGFDNNNTKNDFIWNNNCMTSKYAEAFNKEASWPLFKISFDLKVQKYFIEPLNHERQSNNQKVSFNSISSNSYSESSADFNMSNHNKKQNNNIAKKQNISIPLFINYNLNEFALNDQLEIWINKTILKIHIEKNRNNISVVIFEKRSVEIWFQQRRKTAPRDRRFDYLRY